MRIAQRVSVDGNILLWFDVKTGVKQGCVLSARLFIIYLDKRVQRLRPTIIITTIYIKFCYRRHVLRLFYVLTAGSLGYSSKDCSL